MVDREQCGRLDKRDIAFFRKLALQCLIDRFTHFHAAARQIPAGNIGVTHEEYPPGAVKGGRPHAQRQRPLGNKEPVQKPLEDAARQAPMFFLAVGRTGSRRRHGFLPIDPRAAMSCAMFRLAHISDIHLGPLPKLSARELASKRITGYVNWHRNRRKRLFGNILESLLDDIRSAGPDHLAVTGDLVNLAAKAEIEAATGWLAETGDPQSVSVVPGNHDAYVPGAFEALCHAWRPYMLGDDMALSTGGDNLFPYRRVRGNVALIGVSTASATPPFSANGLFGRRQALALRQQLVDAENEGLFRVVMIHHPPVRGAAKTHKRMIGIRRFGAVMRSAGAELVLHGHTHLDTLYRLPGKNRDVPVVGVPSASEAPGGHRPPAGYNLFTISGEPGAWTCTLDRHGLDEKSEHFQVTSSQEL